MKNELKDHLLLRSSSKKRCNSVVPRIQHPTTASAESRAWEEPTVSSSVNSKEPAWPPQEKYVPTLMETTIIDDEPRPLPHRTDYLLDYESTYGTRACMDSQNSPTSSEDNETGNDPPLPKVDLSKPRYDQSTYQGRLRHFMETTNPLNAFASNKQLDEAATLVNLHKRGECPPGTTEEQLWRAKQLYDSAFNPESGKKKIIIGRMSFQVPGNMFISGMMLTFFKSPYAVTFWQWVNQSFNAVVNYENKSGSNEDSKREVAASFAAATITAAGTGVGLNKIIAKHFSPRSLPARLVPFAAGAAGNMINVPMMRHKELLEGIKLMDENDKDLEHKSKRAAQKAIARTILTRIAISAPAMVFPAVIMEQLEKRVELRAPWMKPTLTVAFVGLSLAFAVPVCLAIFPQQSSMPTSSLEPGVREAILSTHPHIKTVYFNKGL